MKRIISLLVVMAMMLATVLAVIPVSATASTDNSDVPVADVEESAETTRFLPEGAYEAFKAEFEGTAASSAFVNGVTPFAFNQLEAQEKFSGKQILNITLPIKTVGSAFTISVFNIDDMMKASSPVAVHRIIVDESTLTAGKFATIDLTSYDIKVGPNETLAFGGATDTLLPAWYGDTSSLRSVADAKAPFTTGIIGKTGKANAESQPVNSIFMDVEMRDLTESELNTLTRTYISSTALNALKEIYEVEGGANTSTYSPGDAPFVISNPEARAKFSNKRVVDITLPVKETGNVDADGNFTFTITVFDIDDLNSAGPVATYAIKVNAEKYGLAANAKDIHKFVKIDLSEYAINIGEGEVIGLAKSGDSLLPAYATGDAVAINNALSTHAPYAKGFGAYAGTDQYAGNTWDTSSIFFDATLVDLGLNATGTAVTTEAELAAMMAGRNYYLANDLTLSAEWAGVALDRTVFNGNGKTITLTGTNGLFNDTTDSTVKNLTLAGDVTTTTGIAKKVTNGVYKNVTVSLKAVSDSSKDMGVFASGTAGNLTVLNCTNNTPVTGNNAAALAGKFDGNNVYINGFTNNADVTGSNTGAAVFGWYSSGSSLIAKNVVNIGKITANNWAAGMIGANYANKTQLYNCVNGKDGDATKGVVAGKCSKIGAFISESTKEMFVTDCANYANITSTNAAGLVSQNKAVLNVDGFVNKGVIVSTEHAGGVVANSSAVVNLKDVTNTGAVTAPKGAGGYVGNSTANITVRGGENSGVINSTGGGNGAAGVVGYSGTGVALIDVDGFVNKGELKSGLTTGAIVGWLYGATELKVANTTNKGSSTSGYAGGFVGALHNVDAKSTFTNCTNSGAVTGNWAGGFIGEKYQVGELVMTDCTNEGAITMTGNNGMGGIAGKAFASKATLTRVYNKASVTKTASIKLWNSGNGGLIGQTNNGTYYFNDCGNYGAVTGGSDNKGGFIGYYAGSKVYIVNGVNTGDVAGTGNNGGFLGQAGGGTMYYENCVNTGNISSSGNTAGGIQGWGGVSSVTAVNVVNKGDITAKADTKWAAGLFTSPDGASVLLSGCANYGIVTGNSFAAGLVADGATNIAAENCFNAGKVDAKTVYEISNKKYTTTACIITGLHADLLAEAAKLETYAELVEKDEWQAVVDAFAGAKAVYDNAESTAADKIAAVDVIKAAVKETKAYLLTNTTTLSTKEPSIVVNYRLDGAKKTDYIAFVKDGATEATITVLLQDITDNFDLFTAEAAEGKTITEGNYKLYLVSKDVALADVIADPEKAYDVVEILVAANAIMDAEDFMAVAGTDGEYILANDIAVEGGIEFSGTLNGRGNTITLTGNKGLFSKLNGATITNLKIAAASTETVVAYGLADVVTGDVTIDGVTVGTLTISNGDKAAGFINAAEDAESDIVIRNSVTNATVSGTAFAGGVIARATAKSVTIENVTVNGTVNKGDTLDGDNGSLRQAVGGFIGTAGGNVTIKNSTNNAGVYASKGSRGGIVGEYGIEGSVFTANNVVNNGKVDGGNGWPCGEAGIIGRVVAVVTVNMTNCTNNAAVGKEKTQINRGGLVGYVWDGVAASFEFRSCTNNGNVLSEGGNCVGGIVGQADTGIVKLVDTKNYGKIGATWLAGGLVGLAKGFKAYGCENHGEVSRGGLVGGFIAQYNGTEAFVVSCCEAHEGTDKHCEDKFNINTGKLIGGNASGVVGALANAGIRSVSVVNFKNSGAISGSNVAGVIRGTTFNGDGGSLKLVNCSNSGALTSSNGAAGLVNSFNRLDMYITDCENTGNINANGDAAGIVVGITWGNNLIFTNVINRGNVSTTSGEAAGISRGAAWTTKYLYCENYGDVTSPGDAYGFAKYGNGPRTFTECKNFGAITSTGGHAAGIFMSESNLEKQTYNVTDCVNNGKITAATTAGGIATNLQANTGDGKTNFVVNFIRCVNNGEVTTTSTDVNHCIAGIAGHFSGVNAATFEECVNNGIIICPVGDASGIAGWGGSTAPMTFDSCVNTAPILGGKAEVQITYVPGMTNKEFIGEQVEDGYGYNEAITNPTQIWTAEDFAKIKANGRYILMDDIVLPTDYKSIELFGTYNTTITALLDGNGHTIYMKGLSCALFNKLGSATIKNLNLVGYLEGETARAAIANEIVEQAAARDVMNIVIDNVVVDVDITNESGVSVAGFIATSGIVGSKITNLTINDSKFLGNIESTGYAAGFVAYFDTYGEVELNNCVVGDIGLNTTIKGTGRVAAFFAKIRSSADPATTTVTATLTDCVNYATITQVTTGAEGVTGGIIGRVQRITLVLDGVENYGDVTSTRPGLTWYAGVGGLVGEANSNATLTILSSTNYGDVYTDKYYTGGLVGALTNSSKLTVGAIDAEGNVSEGSANYGKVWNGSGWNYGLGGILGGSAWNTKGVGTTDYASEIRIYDTVNYGEVTTKGGANLGGMMGMTDANPALVEVVGCENHGYIHVDGNNRLGGILGQVNATTISIRNSTNYGDVSANNAFNNNKEELNKLPTDADRDFHIDTCHTAGIRPEHYGAAGTVEIINCVNYGTIGSATTKTSAAGITVRVDATTAKVEGCVNYGTIIGPLSTSGVCALPQGEQVKNCANYGLVVNANGSQVAPGADMSNKAYGAVVTDKDLVEIAKKVNASDYKLNDLIGKELTFARPVDLASQIYVGQAGKDVKGNFEYYYKLALDAEKNTLGAMVYDDPTTAIIEVAYAVPAMTYATKLATITNESYFEITLDAKNNTAGTNSGFVYAIAADGTVYSVARDLDAEAAAEGYGQYKVVYDGLVVTVYVMANGDWTQLGDAVTVAAGTSVAVGIANGASDFTYDDVTGEVLGTPAQNQNTATIANVTFKTTYRAGGIVNAFKKIDAVAQELAEADALAAALKVALDEAQAIHDAAEKTEEEAAAAVEVASKALADAALAGKQGADLDPYEKDLADKVAIYERAHQDHTHSKFALDTEKASYEAAKAKADALAASNADDVAAAKAAVDTAIESVLNYAAYNDAVVAKAAMGAKFNAKYAQADRDAYNAAAAKALAATTQADLDAAVEAMSEILNAIDWSAYNYWVDIAESLEENDWTILTWATYKEFLATLDEADKSTQEAVDKLTADIIDAIDALKHDIELADEMQTYITAELEERGWIEENYTPRSWKPFYATVIKPFQDAIDANKVAKSADVETTEQTLRDAYELFNDETEVTYTDLVYIADLKEILDLAAQITDDTTDEGEKTFSEISELYFLLAIPKAEIAYEDAMNEETENADAKQIIADAIAAIEPAYKGLVDVTELNTAIAGYKAEVADKVYTAETWNEFALALSKAEFLAVTAKTAEEIEAAMAALEAAYDALVVLEAIDLDALNEALEAAKKLNEDDYTKASWNALEDAIVDAKIASFSDNQAMIDEAYKALSDAITALVSMPSTESLETLIAEVEALNADEYTAKTWLVLVTALQSAKSALNSESKEVVDEATDALAAAKAELVKKAAADTSALEALIAEIEALKADDYTAETWANVKTALDAAKAALESDEQTVVDVAKAALDAAKANLDKVVVVVETEEEEEEEDEAPVQSSTETTEKKGCKSAIGATVVVMTAVLGLGATVVLKKKEN